MTRLLLVGILMPTLYASAATDVSPQDPKPSRWSHLLRPLASERSQLPEVPRALPESNQEWTIQDALSRALRANPDVQVALASVQRQDGIRLQAVSQIVPHLGIYGSADRRDPALIDRAPKDPIAPPSVETSIADKAYDVRAEVRQTLFDGFSSWNQVRRMALLQKKASVDARELFLRLASQIRQAFDTTLGRQAIVTVRKDAVRDLTHLAGVAQKRFTAGEISEFESLRAQSALKVAEADLAQAEVETARAEELFCRILYIDRPASGLRLAGNMAPLTYTDSFAGALQRAEGGRLDLRSAQLQLDAAKLAQRAAQGGYAPRIDAFVSYSYRSSYYDFNHQLEGWTVGVSGRWDIFDGGQTAGTVRMQRADRRIAEIRLAETQRTVGSQLRELFAALDQAKKLLDAQVSARDLGDRSVREARRSYELGRLSLEEVLNAELTYRQALAGYYGAILTYNTTVYQLDYATGSEEFLNSSVPAGR